MRRLDTEGHHGLDSSLDPSGKLLPCACLSLIRELKLGMAVGQTPLVMLGEVALARAETATFYVRVSRFLSQCERHDAALETQRLGFSSSSSLK